MNDLLKATGPFAPYAAAIGLAVVGIKLILSWRSSDVKEIEREIEDRLKPQIESLRAENADLRSQAASFKARLDELEGKMMGASLKLVELVANCPDEATKAGIIEVMGLMSK